MNARRAFATVAAFFCSTLAHAGPDDYVVMPTVEYGEREIELRIGTASGEGGEPHASAASIALGYRRRAVQALGCRAATDLACADRVRVLTIIGVRLEFFEIRV